VKSYPYILIPSLPSVTKDLTSQRLRQQSTGIIKNPLKNLFVHGGKIMLRDQQILQVDRGPQKRGGHSLASCFFSKEELQALTVQPNQLLEQMASGCRFICFSLPGKATSSLI